MGAANIERLVERVRAWGQADPRVSAVMVYGSVATGQADEWSDLDLLVVTAAGAREELWAERRSLVERLLGEAPATEGELPWQRDHRYQAYRPDLLYLDLTFDEGEARPWGALAGGMTVLIDKDDVAGRLRAALAHWRRPEPDAEAFAGPTWMWLRYLTERLRKNELWRVRSGITSALSSRVLPLFGVAEHTMETALEPADQERLRSALPASSEPAELARALGETVACYEDGLDRWARRTGRPRPAFPLEGAVKERIGALLGRVAESGAKEGSRSRAPAGSAPAEDRDRDRAGHGSSNTSTGRAEDLPDHVRRNRELWDARHSAWFGARARAQWEAEPHWGLWRIPQAELPVFPEDLAGKDLIDLGCGTGYVCAWAARAGARPVGIDNSARQLATARRLQEEFGLSFPLLHGNAEQVPYPDASFDVAISEHGAIGWCDPYRWIPEAARLLRPGGELVFVRNSTLLTLCVPDGGPAGTTLLADQFGLARIEDGSGAVNFHLPHGPMVGLLRRSGFVLEELIEVRAPEGATSDFDYVTPAWARRWPSAEVWKARRVVNAADPP